MFGYGSEGAGSQKDGPDDFYYYISYVRALEDEQVSRTEIARGLMDEFDLEKGEVLKILRRYYAEKDSYGGGDEEEEIDEDDDYGDGNSEY